MELSWIPGSAGSLRIGERHRRGEIAIVFVHGLGGRLEHWSAQLAALGPALHGVALDLPGHGGSDPGRGDSIPALAAAIGAVLDDLGLRRPVVVAHSLGALAAIEYAGGHPQRVAGLLLVDPSGDQSRLPEDERARYLESVRADPAAETAWSFRQLLVDASPAVADRVMESLEAVPAEVLLDALEGAVAYSPLPALERFGGPVRSLVTEFNRLPQSLHNLRPEIAVRAVAGASHWLMMDRPREVWAELVDFLEELRGRGLV